MGFIRKGVLVFVCILMFVLILVGNSFLTLGLSLKYDNVKSELVPVAREMFIGNANIDDKLKSDFDSTMKFYCQTNSEFTFSQQDYTFVIPCSVVANGSDAVVAYGVNSFVKEIYYKNYDCDFWKCFEESQYPTFLVSEKAQNYWMGKFYLILIIFLVLAGLTYFLVENKENAPFILGILLAVGSLPFLAIGKIASLFIDKTYIELVAAFFSSAHSVFLISLILGLILLGIGIGLKFWDFEQFISAKFNKKKK